MKYKIIIWIKKVGNITTKKTIAPGLNKEEINPSLNKSKADRVPNVLSIVTLVFLIKNFIAKKIKYNPPIHLKIS
jgi:hypothetical protein